MTLSIVFTLTPNSRQAIVAAGDVERFANLRERDAGTPAAPEPAASPGRPAYPDAWALCPPCQPAQLGLDALQRVRCARSRLDPLRGDERS